MARYIDAERMPNDCFWEGLTDKEKTKVLQWLLQSPTADVVEVVRCGKCKHWRKMGYDPIFKKGFGHCYNNDFPFMCETRPDTDEDDFCSYGVKK